VEKSRARYRLGDIKDIVASYGISAFTQTAVMGIERLGLSDAEGVSVVLNLTSAMFYKSMTTYVNHRVWQDVYHAPCPNGKMAYIKLTLQKGAVVIQFKEL